MTHLSAPRRAKCHARLLHPEPIESLRGFFLVPSASVSRWSPGYSSVRHSHHRCPYKPASTKTKALLGFAEGGVVHGVTGCQESAEGRCKRCPACRLLTRHAPRGGGEGGARGWQRLIRRDCRCEVEPCVGLFRQVKSEAQWFERSQGENARTMVSRGLSKKHRSEEEPSTADSAPVELGGYAAGRVEWVNTWTSSREGERERTGRQQ